MAVALRVRLEGDEAFRRNLAKLRLPQAEPIYRRSLRENAERVRETTQREFLSGQMLAVRSGGLRRSIAIDERNLPRLISIGSDLPQAPPLHWGWPRRNIEPHPFFEAALDRSFPHLPDPWIREIERQAGGGR